ncbi:MAG: hypothetical protein EHM20_01710 [Alphaproteobacteria bacterium]|nr:MAG: hypothetical protein EHM20_01710 [Alphaproteobacteria bacterium]
MKQLFIIHSLIILLILEFSGCSSVPTKDSPIPIIPIEIKNEFNQVNTNFDLKFNMLHDEIKQQMNNINFDFDYIKKELQFTNNNINNCCRNCNDINSIDLRTHQQNDTDIKKILINISELEKHLEMFIVETNKKLLLQENDIQHVRELSNWNKDTISRQVSIFSLIMATSIGAIAVLIAITVFILNRDRKIVEREEKKLREQDKKEYEIEIRKLMDEQSSLLNQLGYYEHLKLILSKPKPTAEEIYPFLTPLSSRPSIMFLPLFKKIIDLNISPEITAKAQEGLERINYMPKK